MIHATLRHIPLGCLLTLALTTGAAEAGLIAPSSLVATASSSVHATNRHPRLAVNGAGLTVLGHTNAAENTMWASANQATSAAIATQWYRIELPALYNVDNLRIWNYNQDSGFNVRSIKQFDLFVSAVNNPGNPLANPGNWTLELASQTLNMAPGTSNYNTYQDIALSTAGIKYLALANLQHFATDSFGAYVGLSEVQVSGMLVPEPSTFALAGLGAALLFSWKRRRR